MASGAVQIDTLELGSATQGVGQAVDELERLQGVLTQLGSQQATAFDPVAKRAGAPQAYAAFLQSLNRQIENGLRAISGVQTSATKTVPAAVQTTSHEGVAAIHRAVEVPAGGGSVRTSGGSGGG